MTVRSPGHTVLASADSNVYTSVRRRPSSRAERYAIGRALRREVPRKSLGIWRPADDRPDPVELIKESHEGRLDWLIPVRVARMVSSPYGFLRGTAIVMAEDVARTAGDRDHPGDLRRRAPGQLRLLRLARGRAGDRPERLRRGPSRRLGVGPAPAGRQHLGGRAGERGGEEQCATSVLACVAAYRDEVRFLAEQPLLMRCYNRLDVSRLHETATEKSLRDEIERSAKRARTRTSDRALPRFTVEHEGRRHIVEEPPLITRLIEQDDEAVADALDDYLDTLAPHWRRVLGGYTLVDIAHKVVGVGSVGLRAYVALLEGSTPDDVVFLQLKQARRSVLARYVHGDSAWHAHQGQRVVEYQQALQTVSDPLLGWTTVGELQYYVRQFRNMKGTIPLDAIDAAALADYAGIVGHLLAKGHARTSGASMIAGYAGGSDKLDQAMARFARAYADQTEADHATLVKAVRRGDLPVTEGALEGAGSAFRP